MPPDSPPAAVPAPELPTSAPPSLFALFVAFAKMSLAGFGGVLVWARRGIVDQHRWMTADEFNETFALCHFLPGPNIVNLSVVFGSRFRGIAGGVAAFAGLLGPPVVIVTILAALYARFGEIECAAAHFGRRVLRGGRSVDIGGVPDDDAADQEDAIWSALCVLAAVFTAIGLLRLPLPAVLLVAIPLSIAITFAMRRRADGMNPDRARF